MRLRPPARHHCPACDAALPAGARFCPACARALGGGAAPPATLHLDLDLDLDLDPRATGESDGSPAPPARRRRRVHPLLGLSAALVAAIGSLWLLDPGGRGSSSPGDPAPASAVSSTVVSSTVVSSTVVSSTTASEGVSSTTTSSAAGPDSPTGGDAAAHVRSLGVLAVPAGVTGVLYGLSSSGILIEIDLADGEARSWQFGEDVYAGESALTVLDRGLLLDRRGEVQVVPFDEPFRFRGPSSGLTRGADAAHALLDDERPGNSFFLLDGDGAGEGPFDLGSSLYPLAVVGDRVATVAGGRIALVDPRSGQAEELAVGDVVYADGDGVIWRDCSELVHCRMRAGTWSDVGRFDLSGYLPVIEGGLDADFLLGGKMLRLSTYPDDGRGAVHLLIDLASGRSWPLPSARAEVTLDGRWVVRPTGGSAFELRPLAGGDAATVIVPGDLNLVDLALTNRHLAT